MAETLTTVSAFLTMVFAELELLLASVWSNFAPALIVMGAGIGVSLTLAIVHFLRGSS